MSRNLWDKRFEIQGRAFVATISQLVDGAVKVDVGPEGAQQRAVRHPKPTFANAREAIRAAKRFAASIDWD